MARTRCFIGSVFLSAGWGRSRRRRPPGSSSASTARPADRPPSPTRFTTDNGDLLIHLARPNPVWKAIEHDPNVTFTVIGDYAFIPGP
ncbi:FMN-binding negative transcriptional regulator [Streptomyces sp. NBC_01435]|uniref:FMN-binding negative transcriptional regulator n=1 Tax=Streptomyces sp. NBC_01435 TaxID=2903865 RepID=UPI003FCE2FAB